jgi:diacylglycerol kinase (ATP)
VHESAYPLQVDGDYFRNRDIAADSTLDFSISPNAIPVLIPRNFSKDLKT